VRSHIGGGGYGIAHYGGPGATHFGGSSSAMQQFGSGVHSPQNALSRGGTVNGLPNRLADRPGTTHSLHPGDAFRSNWSHNFDRWNSAAFRGRGGEERRERFGLGFEPFDFFGGYPLLDFSYLPYYYPYSGYSDYGWLPDYGTGGYPYYDYSNYDSSAAGELAPYYVSTDGIDTMQPLAAAESGNRPSPGTYYTEALDAFRRGDYHEAMRLTQHAAVDMPQDVKIHQLLTQTLFALGVYRQAAIEAHAARALGPALHWETLTSYYGDISTYTPQLRALEKYIADHPNAADARFLLAHQYEMLGHTKNALQNYEAALKLVPADKLAAKLVKDLGGQAAESVAKIAAPSAEAAQAR
jgi:hypothetical protein